MNPKLISTKMPASQRGVAMVFVTIGMLAILGMAGLALDMGHAYVNKTRLQNALDAAAISGAKTLDQFPGQLDRAEADAKNTFRITAAGAGNAELDAEVSNAEITVQFYATLIPLAAPANPGNTDARYVRVSVNSFDKTMFLARVLPGVGDTMTVGGSAVAGPSPQLIAPCNLVPIMLCAGAAPYPANTVYGYNIGQEYRLTVPPGTNSDVGPGNFRLLNMGGPGANVLRQNLAGGYAGCVDPGAMTEVETEPGLNEGPVAQGLNTRLGRYQGAGVNPADYPPDTNTCTAGAAHYTYGQYRNNPECVGPQDTAGSAARMPERRILAIPMADCSGDDSGRSTLPLAGFACMFLTREVPQGGPPATRGVYAEMLSDGCLASGRPGPNPVTGPGPHTIQLYQDPLSDES